MLAMPFLFVLSLGGLLVLVCVCVCVCLCLCAVLVALEFVASLDVYSVQIR